MRQFGSKPVSKASKRAAAMHYVYGAREPDPVFMTRAFGVSHVEAERLIAEAKQVRGMPL